MQVLNLVIKKSSFFLFLIFTFLILYHSPEFFNKIQPDSSSYINPSPFRQILYHYLYVTLKKINLDIIFFQIFLMSLSIVCLFSFLKKNKKVNIYLLILFYSFITLNFYYTSFTKTILSEAIFFSLIIFAFILMFHLQNKFCLLFFGLVSGIIVAFKPVGIIFIIIFLIFSLLFTKSYKKLMQIIFLISLPIILENYMFYSKYTERKTIFSYSVMGKLFFLSGKNTFNIENYPKEYHELLTITKNKFYPIHDYIRTIDNLLLRFELLSDYEVVAQYQVINSSILRDISLDKEQIINDTNYLFLQIIKNNFLDYVKLSFSHYIGNWSIGNKSIFLDTTENDIPNIKELINSSGPMNIPNNELLLLAQIFFLVLFLILTLYSLLVFILKILRFKEVKYDDVLLVTLIQVYLLAVSFTNISTPRYLMAIYPFLLISCINFYSLTKKLINKSD